MARVADEIDEGGDPSRRRRALCALGRGLQAVGLVVLVAGYVVGMPSTGMIPTVVMFAGAVAVGLGRHVHALGLRRHRPGPEPTR